MQRILILGATSAIAEAVARHYAGRGASLFLAGRDAQRLAHIAADLKVRGAREVVTGGIDFNQIDQHAALLESARSALGGIDVALLAWGTLPDQTLCDGSVEATLAAVHTNGVAPIALMTALVPLLQAPATLAVISSVAGDRGRASNAAYGSAKAAVSAYASGLRQRLNGRGINVLTIKPGFVDTPMTASFRKGALWAQPETVAAAIVRAIERGRGEAYVPWFWWGIMQVIRHIPEFVFRRVKL
jgi:decaprenylphospho-beta-D-erythro-pentofuranosid-2-ulose 2-reductase